MSNSATNGFNKTAKTIGSIKNKQVNYDSQHSFFNKNEHMPDKAQRIRTVVQDEIDKDLLGTKKQRWNSSVTASDKFDAYRELPV